jgi:hypothetical protein
MADWSTSTLSGSRCEKVCTQAVKRKKCGWNREQVYVNLSPFLNKGPVCGCPALARTRLSNGARPFIAQSFCALKLKLEPNLQDIHNHREKVSVVGSW